MRPEDEAVVEQGRRRRIWGDIPRGERHTAGVVDVQAAQARQPCPQQPGGERVASQREAVAVDVDVAADAAIAHRPVGEGAAGDRPHWAVSFPAARCL